MRAREFVVETTTAGGIAPVAMPIGSIVRREDIEQTAQRMDLSQALDDLPEKLREVLIMRFYHDMTFREISAELGTHPSYAQYLVQKALRYLRHSKRGLADRDDLQQLIIPAQFFTEDLRKWFREKWVRFGPDGKIRGQCARDSEGEGKPKCLPQAKAHALGKKGRKTAASRKRRQDPNKNRTGAAKNVKTESIREDNI